jgi:hypothetical protein
MAPGLIRRSRYHRAIGPLDRQLCVPGLSPGVAFFVVLSVDTGKGPAQSRVELSVMGVTKIMTKLFGANELIRSKRLKKMLILSLSLKWMM